MEVRCVVEAGDILGESPVWDDAGGVLRWLDIHGRRLHSFAPESGLHAVVSLAEQAGSIGLRAAGGLVAATRTGFSSLDPQTGAMEVIAGSLEDGIDVRFNDGRVDRAGRFWSGTVQEKRVPGGAALYRLSPDRSCDLMLDGVTVSNGIAWSPDDRRMYFADSHAREISVFDYDLAAGAIADRRLFARFPVEHGVPDGATVDEAGNLWSAGFGGWRVFKFNPEGRLAGTVRLPVAQPTSCSFGGRDLATLYVTSARVRLTDDELSGQPLAGHLFAVDVGARGLREPRYGG